jgi:hypothetical protein
MTPTADQRFAVTLQMISDKTNHHSAAVTGSGALSLSPVAILALKG